MARIKINSGTGAKVKLNDGSSGNVSINREQAPDAPTSGVVDDTNNTFDWTNNPLFINLSDYEYSLNGAAYTEVMAKPIAIGNINVEIGDLRLRLKAVGDIPASSALTNASIFEVSPKVTPSAPNIVAQNNTTKQLHFHAPSGYRASDCQYKIQGGAPVNATSTVIEIGSTDLAIGDVEIYVKAGTGRNQSASVFSTAAFTQSIILTAVTVHSNVAADFYTAAANGMFLNTAPNSKIVTTATARRIQFKLSALPTIGYMWFFVYRKDGATYDIVGMWANPPVGDMVVGVNEMFIPGGGGWGVQAGDYVGFAIAGDAALVAMFPRTDDTAPGEVDMRSAPSVSGGSDKDWDSFTGIETGFYPIIITT